MWVDRRVPWREGGCRCWSSWLFSRGILPLSSKTSSLLPSCCTRKGPPSCHFESTRSPSSSFPNSSVNHFLRTLPSWTLLHRDSHFWIVFTRIPRVMSSVGTLFLWLSARTRLSFCEYLGCSLHDFLWRWGWTRVRWSFLLSGTRLSACFHTCTLLCGCSSRSSSEESEHVVFPEADGASQGQILCWEQWTQSRLAFIGGLLFWRWRKWWICCCSWAVCTFLRGAGLGWRRSVRGSRQSCRLLLSFFLWRIRRREESVVQRRCCGRGVGH